MTEPKGNLAEREFRYGRLAIMAALVTVVAVGGLGLATAFAPENGTVRVLGTLVPVLAVVPVLVLSRLRRRLVGTEAPPHPVHDEWSQAQMDRASRLALLAVIVGQLPLAVLMARLPTTRALLGMGVATFVLALGGWFGSYLYLTREDADG